MAFLETEYKIDDMPEGTSYELLPAGWYSAKITEADLKDTKSGNGQYIKMRYDITGLTHEGRVVFGNINIRNPNPKAEEIGRQQLGDIMRAIGLGKVSDTDQLIGGELQIKVRVKPAEGEYDAQNEVRGFKALGGGAPEPKDAKSESASAPPWAKK